MIEIEEEVAHYLAKAEEDPYSKAILDIINVRIEMIQSMIKSRKAFDYNSNQIFHQLGQLFALEILKNLPDEARKHLDELPGEEREKEA